MLVNGSDFSVQLNKHVFDTVGNRRNYSFKLELNNGISQNNIEG